MLGFQMAVAISEDALKLLVAENGVRGTARMLGMDEREMERFKKRVARAGWVQEPEMLAVREKSGLPMAGAPLKPLLPKKSPNAAIAQELNNLGQKTRLGLARGMAKAGEHIAELPAPQIVADAQNIKAIAQTADLVHGWKDTAPQVKIRLDVLAAPQETGPVIDVETSISDSDTLSSELDEY